MCILQGKTKGGSWMKVVKGYTFEWVSPQYLILNGRIRTKGIAHPRRERVLVRTALRKIGLRYREIVPFINPHFKGHLEEHDRSISWLDFCIFHKKMYVLLFNPKRAEGGMHAWQKKSWQSKLQVLEEKGIPYLILDKNLSSQEYEFLIRRRIGERYGSRPSTTIPT